MQQLQSLLGGGVVSSGEGATYQNTPQQLLQIHPQLLQVSSFLYKNLYYIDKRLLLNMMFCSSKLFVLY